jgi:nitronate monooxygenase
VSPTAVNAPTPSISTALTSLLAIRHPVLLAPMGDTAGGRLAAAVSDAGGLGLIGGGYADPEWLERELALAGSARVGVGFITFALDQRPDTLRVALDASPVAVQLAFGDPRPYAEQIHAAGALLLCHAQSDAEVTRAVEAGADVIIAQGRDAGGHGRGDLGTMALVPSLVDRLAPTPVVAAGGIADGRGLAAALVLGAAGVSLGTRLLATTEAISSDAEAAAIVAGRGADTVRTSAFDAIRGPTWPDGFDGRTLRNDLTETWDGTPSDPVAHRRYQDDPSLAPVWAGEALDLVTAVAPAADVLERMVTEAIAQLEDTARRVDPVRSTATGSDQGGDPPCWEGLVQDQRDRPDDAVPD